MNEIAVDVLIAIEYTGYQGSDGDGDDGFFCIKINETDHDDIHYNIVPFCVNIGTTYMMQNSIKKNNERNDVVE